jgi:hypothetical protein
MYLKKRHILDTNKSIICRSLFTFRLLFHVTLIDTFNSVESFNIVNTYKLGGL